MNETVYFPHMGKVAEAAERSGLSEYRIRCLVASGKIRSVRAGNRILVNLDSLAQYMTTGDPVPPPSSPVRRIEPLNRFTE